MDTFTIAAAARLCHCDRRTLQPAIHAGRLHLDAQHCLSREALLAAGYLVLDPPQSAPPPPPPETPPCAPLAALLEPLTSALTGLQQEIQHLTATLQRTSLGTPQGTPQRPPPPAPHSAPQETPQHAPQDTTPTAHNAAAVARIHALRDEGRSLAQIAEVLNAEGVPTRRGQPWRKGIVGHLLKAGAPRARG